jgi:pimeloyl-ACP methyl ester carboxylesterase
MKKIYLAAFLLFSLLTLILGSPSPAHSQFTWPPGCEQGSLPSHDPKNPSDQLIVICIPSNWNGRLVIYAHGFVPPQAPLALPTDELTLTDGTFVPNLFLSLGFAFATSSFHKNGLAIEQGAEDLNRLLQYFRSVVPPRSLQRVFITGASEGGLIGLLLLERFPGKYDAGLALCAPVGGSADFIKYAYDFRVVFDYFFPTVFTFPPDQPGEQPFGAVDVPQNAFLFWETVYIPRILAALAADPISTAQLFNVTKAAIDVADPDSVITTALSLLFYSIFGTNDQIATAGGTIYDARRFYQPKGNLHAPLVTLHTTLDEVVPFQHVVNYSNLVALKGKSAFLSIVPVPRYGHCNFTSQEVFQAFALMVQQAEAQLIN